MIALKVAVVQSELAETGGIERVPLMHTLLLRQRKITTNCYASIIDRMKCYPDIIRNVNPIPIVPWLKSPLHGLKFKHLISILWVKMTKALVGHDLLIAHYQPAPWLCYFIKKKYGTPYVHYANGICKELYPRAIDIATVPEKKIMRFILKKLQYFTQIDYESILAAEVCFANSKHIKRSMEKIYHISNIPVVYPGIDLNTFHPVHEKKIASVKSKYNIKTPYIFTSNRHIGYKKIEWLIEMMPMILKEKPEISLVNSGMFNPSYTPKLHRIKKDLGLEGKVIFTGSVNEQELAALYCGSDLYVYSPPDEDFGLGPVEAMCCGKPVVAWDAAGPGETIIDGKTGLLAKPYDLSDFASKCLKILINENLKDKMSKSALERGREFSWDNHIQKFIEKIKELKILPEIPPK